MGTTGWRDGEASAMSVGAARGKSRIEPNVPIMAGHVASGTRSQPWRSYAHRPLGHSSDLGALQLRE